MHFKEKNSLRKYGEFFYNCIKTVDKVMEASAQG